MEERTTPDAAEESAYEELQCYTLGLRDAGFVHQHVVDAWTAQHASDQSRPIGVAFALAGLCLHVEHGWTGRQVQRAHMSMARSKELWPSFPLPGSRGSVGAGYVMNAAAGAERLRAIDQWCASVWSAFGECHPAIDALLRRHGIL